VKGFVEKVHRALASTLNKRYIIRRMHSQLRGRIPGLDGLRGIAILLTLICHSPQVAQYRWDRATWVGVNLFFVLSGYLITGILIDSSTAPNYYRDFYARRALRIWPIYFITFAVTALLIPIAMPHMRSLFGYSRLWYVVLVQNYFDQHGIYPLLAPTWSLAIEEQFYLVWPFLIAAIPSRKWLLAISIVGLIASPFVRGAFLQAIPDPTQLTWVTFLRLDGLLFGAGLAVLVRTPGLNRKAFRIVMLLAAVGGLGSFLATNAFTEHINFPWIYSMVDIGFGGVVGLTLASTVSGGWLSRLLSFSPLRYFGQISYGLYLLHKLVFAALAQLHGFKELPSLVAVLVQITLAAAVAAFSWHFFESRVIAFGSAFRHPVRTQAATATA
jgi:peptidoglycan/LPS O-acetylase OafA/YrhL